MPSPWPEMPGTQRVPQGSADMVPGLVRNQAKLTGEHIGFHGEFIDSWIFFKYLGAQMLDGRPFLDFHDENSRRYTLLGSVVNYDVYDEVYRMHEMSETIPTHFKGLFRGQALTSQHLIFLPTYEEGDPVQHARSLEAPVILIPSFDAYKRG